MTEENIHMPLNGVWCNFFDASFFILHTQVKFLSLVITYSVWFIDITGARANHWAELMIQRDVLVYLIASCIHWQPIWEARESFCSRKQVPKDEFSWFQLGKTFFQVTEIIHIYYPILIFLETFCSYANMLFWFLRMPLVKKLCLIPGHGLYPRSSSFILSPFTAVGCSPSVKECRWRNGLSGGLANQSIDPQNDSVC